MNGYEVIKSEKNPLEVLGDLDKLVVSGAEELSRPDLERLRWAGLFYRRRVPGTFMVRVRTPGGVLSAEQAVAVAGISERYAGGEVALNNRQGLQLRPVRPEDTLLARGALKEVGLGTLQTGGDSIRSIMGCPMGSPEARSTIEELTAELIGNPGYANLPRKMNVSVSGCSGECGIADTQDIAILPFVWRDEDGELRRDHRFKIGGGMGSIPARMAEPLDIRASREEVIPVVRALVEIFRDHGSRERRGRSRFKFLVEEWGVERLRAGVEKRCGRRFPRTDVPEVESPASPFCRGEKEVGAFEQPDGTVCVGAAVPMGLLRAGQLAQLGEIARRHGDGELWITPSQNILIYGVPRKRIGNLTSEPLFRELRLGASSLMDHAVACTGKTFCAYAQIETKDFLRRVISEVEREVKPERPVSIHLSGCPNACGHHQVADIGLLGRRIRRGDEIVEVADLFLGGGAGPGATVGEAVLRDVPLGQVKEVLIGLLMKYRMESEEDVPFREWILESKHADWRVNG